MSYHSTCSRLKQYAAALLIAAPVWGFAVEPLQIKGRVLGQAQQTACAGATKTSRGLDEVVEEYRDSTPTLKLTNSSDCEISEATFAGKPLAGEMNLLFVEGRLIQLKFELQPLDISGAVSVLKTLELAYGKPRRDKKLVKYGVMTDYWSRGAQELHLSWSGLDTDRFSLEVVLRDVKDFAAFQKVYEYNKKQLERTAELKRLSDTK